MVFGEYPREPLPSPICQLCRDEMERSEVEKCTDCRRVVCPACRIALDRPDFPTSDVACDQCKADVLVRFEAQIAAEKEENRSPLIDAGIDRLEAASRNLFEAIARL